MVTTAERMRTYDGPAILSYGFRPFFLFGAIWAALAVAIWLPMLAGSLALPTVFAPIDWHVHELLYGYLPAIVAGFLLTAVPNWTGRLWRSALRCRLSSRPRGRCTAGRPAPSA